MTSGRFRLAVFHRRVEDRHLLANRRAGAEIFRHTTFHSRHHQVLDPDIGESAAGHDEIVAAPAAVAVKIRRLNPARDEVTAGRRVRLNRTGRGNVVRRNRIAENAQRTGAPDILDLSGRHREVRKKRRIVDVIALLIPFVDLAGARTEISFHFGFWSAKSR